MRCFLCKFSWVFFHSSYMLACCQQVVLCHFFRLQLFENRYYHLLVVEKVLRWFKKSGLRKTYNNSVSIAAFPFSGTEADLSSKLCMTV